MQQTLVQVLGGRAAPGAPPVGTSGPSAAVTHPGHLPGLFTSGISSMGCRVSVTCPPSSRGAAPHHKHCATEGKAPQEAKGGLEIPLFLYFS